MKVYENRYNELTPLDDDNYVFLFEELELAMPEKHLYKIKEFHNSGMPLHEIASEVKKNVYEVLIALLYLVKKNHKLLPFNYDVIEK